MTGGGALWLDMDILFTWGGGVSYNAIIMPTSPCGAPPPAVLYNRLNLRSWDLKILDPLEHL